MSNDTKQELEGLLKEKASLETRINEIATRMSQIRFDNKPVVIDLEREIFLILYDTATRGYRELDDLHYRKSEIMYCSWLLFFDRIYMIQPPAIEPTTIKNKVSGVVSIPNGIATVGSIIHEFLQRRLIEKFGPQIIQAEREIKYQFIIDGLTVTLTGHIDLDFPITGYKTLADFKTTSDENFKKIVGLMSCGPDEYAMLKAESSSGQANSYGVVSGLEGKEIVIAWISQKDLSLKIEKIIVNGGLFLEACNKIGNIVQALVKYRNGDETARPKPAGVMNCNVCKHLRIHCLGKDAVLGGQKTLEQFKAK